MSHDQIVRVERSAHVLKQNFTRFYWYQIAIFYFRFKISKDFRKSVPDLQTVGDSLATTFHLGRHAYSYS